MAPEPLDVNRIEAYTLGNGNGRTGRRPEDLGEVELQHLGTYIACANPLTSSRRPLTSPTSSIDRCLNVAATTMDITARHSYL